MNYDIAGHNGEANATPYSFSATHMHAHTSTSE